MYISGQSYETVSIFTGLIIRLNQEVENEAAQCGLQQTPTAVKTEPNQRGYI